MQIVIDSRPLNVSASGQSLGVIIDRVQAMIIQRRRVVHQVTVDGGPVAEQLRAQPSELFEQLEFRTCCPRALARQMLLAVATMLNDTAKMQQAAVEKLSAGQLAKAMELLLGCLNHYRLADESVGKAVLVTSTDLDDLNVGQLSARDVIDVLSGKLADARNALESQEFATLGELLTCKLEKMAEQWREVVGQLERRLALAELTDEEFNRNPLRNNR